MLKRTTWFKVLTLLAVLSMLLAAVGCKKEVAEEAVGEVTVSQATDADILEPLMISVTAAGNVEQQMCQPLIASNPFTADPVPVLATEWERVDDYTWRFKIREGVKFHNGNVMTTEDVAYSYNRVLTEEKNRMYTAKRIMEEDPDTGRGGGATVIDDEWVEVKTNQIYPSFLDGVVSGIKIVNKAHIDEVGFDAHNLAPVCTGPYKFVEWVKDDHITMEAFEDYWGEKPKVKTVIWKPIPDGSTRVAALEAGDTDIIINVPPLEADRFEADQDDGIYMANVFSRRSLYVGINTFLEPFHDVRVRQAVGYAIDKETIISQVLNGHGNLMGSPLVPENYGYDPSVTPWPYDVEKAKELLREAGWYDDNGDGVAECHGCEGPEGYYKEGDDLVIDFDVPHGRYNMDREVGEAIAGMLPAAGFKVNLKIAEWAAFYQIYLAASPDPDTGIPGGKTRDKGCNGLFWLGTGKDATPDGYFITYWHSKGRHFYFEDDEIDSLIDQASSTYDDAERKRLFSELQHKTKESAHMIFVYQQQDLYGVREGVKFTASPDEGIWLHPYTGGKMLEVESK